MDDVASIALAGLLHSVSGGDLEKAEWIMRDIGSQSVPLSWRTAWNMITESGARYDRQNG